MSPFSQENGDPGPYITGRMRTQGPYIFPEIRGSLGENADSLYIGIGAVPAGPILAGSLFRLFNFIIDI